MKYFSQSIPGWSIIILIVVASSCKKQEVPIVETSAITNINITTAKCGGTITDEGSGTVIERGVCWSTSITPTIADNLTTDGGGAGSYTSEITNLDPAKTYYIRAYAKNEAGLGYGMAMSFTTLPPTFPSVSTTGVTSITQTTARSGGTITSNGGSVILNQGVCWNTTGSPTLSDNHTFDGVERGTFISNVTGLTGNTSYCFRAYAQNSVGVAYGNPVYFVTKPTIPSLVTSRVTFVTSTSATVEFSITTDGGSQVFRKGVCWSENQNPTLENATGVSSTYNVAAISDLAASTTYYVRAFAVNMNGIGYGNELSFVTQPPILSQLRTTSVFVYDTKSASVNCIVENGGGAEVTSRGICWGTSTKPTLDDNIIEKDFGLGSFSCEVTGLLSGTTYYVRAYATNSAGTAYGNELNFNTYADPVSDIDGNVYKAVKIGDQIWMGENLRTTKFTDGTPITNVVDNNSWATAGAAFCWYNNDQNFKPTYGALYNWLAVSTGVLCPVGWHIPSDSEWTTLELFLGVEYAGIRLKEAGFTHWLPYVSSDGYANSTYFTALPGGHRNRLGTYEGMGYTGWWWSLTEYNSIIYLREIDYQLWSIERFLADKNNGLSVRCIKD